MMMITMIMIIIIKNINGSPSKFCPFLLPLEIERLVFSFVIKPKSFPSLITIIAAFSNLNYLLTPLNLYDRNKHQFFYLLGFNK